MADQVLMRDQARQERERRRRQKHLGVREGFGSAADNEVDSRVMVYLNPGAWTGGRTGFGLVGREYVIACSLLAWPEKPKPRLWGKGLTKTQSGAAEFIAHLVRKNQIDWDNPAHKFIGQAKDSFPDLEILAYYRAPGRFRFANDDQLLIFLPDMHMNLYREMPIDAFVTRDAHKQRSSVIHLLLPFLDFIRQFKQQNPSFTVDVIQLGDLVDVWHTQNVFLKAHRFLYEYAQDYKKKHGVEPREFQFHYTRENELWDQPQHNTLTETVRLADWPAQANAFHAWALYILAHDFHNHTRKKRGYHRLPLPWKLRNVALDYTDRLAIEQKIRDGYPEMTGGGVDRWPLLLTNWVRGNHDMDEAHPYFAGGTARGLIEGFRDRHQYPVEYYYGATDIRRTHDAYWTSKPELKDRPRPAWDRYDDRNVTLAAYTGDGYGYVTGRNGCIWYEHGHAFDPFNHRRVWWREDSKNAERDAKFHAMTPHFLAGGFPVTGKYIRELLEYTIHQGGWLFEFGDKLGDLGLEWYAYDRVEKIFEKYSRRPPGKGQGPIHLVVMGHTHVLHLEDSSDWRASSKPFL